MPVTFVKGDFINELPKGQPRAFACPVDVLGTTDAGIAAAVAKRWPGFAEWWRQQRKQVGDVAVFEPEGGREIIFALVTQRGAKRSKLGWIDRAFRAMIAEATKRNVTHINVPRLWGGQSGLDGARAKRVLDEAAIAAPIQVTVFEQFIRAPEAAPEAEADQVDAEPDAPSAAAPKKKTAAKKKTTAKKKATAKAPAKKKATAKAPAKKKVAAAPAKKKVAATKKKTAAKKPAAKKKAATKKKAAR